MFVLSVPITVVETPSFVREASAALDEKERVELIGFLAASPDAGDVMPGTGGGRNCAGVPQAAAREVASE